jgi:hypothetical protein
MPCLNLLRIVVVVISLHCSFGTQAEGQPPRQDTTDSVHVERAIFGKWVAENLYFFPDSRGRTNLFLRRQPVKAAILPASLQIKDEVSHLIAALSTAAGVSYELTSSDVNLAIVVDTPINKGDKPNPELWRRVGLSEEMYTIASEQGSWASGCGTYSFGNKETGQVGLSITFADSKLEPARIRDCVIDGTVRAFGLRSNRKSVLTADDGYFQFVALAKALTACEQKIGIERLVSMSEDAQRSKYSECASDLLK